MNYEHLKQADPELYASMERVLSLALVVLAMALLCLFVVSTR